MTKTIESILLFSHTATEVEKCPVGDNPCMAESANKMMELFSKGYYLSIFILATQILFFLLKQAIIAIKTQFSKIELVLILVGKYAKGQFSVLISNYTSIVSSKPSNFLRIELKSLMKLLFASCLDRIKVLSIHTIFSFSFYVHKQREIRASI